MKKFLIIQTAFIGDVILALPLAELLKSNFEDCKVDFLCIPGTSELLKGNRYIDSAIIYDKRTRGRSLREFIRIVRQIRKKKYYCVLSPHRFLRSTLISCLSGAELTISFDKSTASFLYKRRIKYSEKHEILRNQSLLEPLGISVNEINRPVLNPSEKDKSEVEKIMKGLDIRNNLVCIAPGSVWFTKTYPKNKFLNLLNQMSDMDIKIALIGSANDTKTNEYLLVNSINNNVYNFAGKLSLLQTADLISKSRLLVTNDSAPLHIANAVNTPVVAIFGATVPAFGFYPYGSKDSVVQVNGLHCRPCSIHGSDKCPVKSFDCMEKIDEKYLLSEIRKILN